MKKEEIVGRMSETARKVKDTGLKTGDALKTIQFQARFGNPNCLPLNVWFEGLEVGQSVNFQDSGGKPHTLKILHISRPNEDGTSEVRYVLDSEFLNTGVQLVEPTQGGSKGVPMADPNNIYQVPSPSNGDLWVMYVAPGDVVTKGEEIFNVSIMKQEKAVLSPVDGIVKRVLKTADFKENKKMVPVREGELLVELAPAPRLCPNKACHHPLTDPEAHFCPKCGMKLDED